MILLAAAVGAFTAFWTWIGWLRYQTLHLTVYDFGLIYQEIWATAHGQSPWQLGAGSVHPLVLGFVPFYGLFPGQSAFFLFLLAVNSAAVAVGAVPLYLIVRDRYPSQWLALGVAGAYLAFPAVAGSVWFPVHLESFFPVLFLTGYWLYRRNQWVWACAAWTAAMITNIGAPVIVAAFALGIVAEPFLARAGWWEKLRGRPRPVVARIPRRRLLLSAYLVSAAAVVFSGIALALIAYNGSQGFVNFLLVAQASTPLSTGGTSVPGYLAVIGRQTMTVVLLIGPLLGLPLLGREERWAMLPFFAHAFILGSPEPFLWPFKDQYFCYVLPGLFAGAVRGLERPWGFSHNGAPSDRLPKPPTRVQFWRDRPPGFRWGMGALAGVLLVGLVFAPWGPANPALGSVYGLAQGSYDFPEVTTANASGVQAVRSLVAITPAAGNLLVQNNLPEPLNRFHYVVPGYHTTNQSISYVLTDPYDPSFYSPNFFGPYPASMLQWANFYLATGSSILGEAEGALLLSLNSSGPPQVYRPLSQSFGPSEFGCCGAGTLSNISAATTLVSGPNLPVQGNYSVWSPGNFTLTVALTEDRPSPTNLVSVGLTYGIYAASLANFSVSGANASASGLLVDSFALHVPVYLPMMHLTLTVERWAGVVQFKGIWLNQTAPITVEYVGAPWSTAPRIGPVSARSTSEPTAAAGLLRGGALGALAVPAIAGAVVSRGLLWGPPRRPGRSGPATDSDRSKGLWPPHRLGSSWDPPRRPPS